MYVYGSAAVWQCVRADDDASDVSATLVAKCRIKQRAWYIKSPRVSGHVEAKCRDTGSRRYGEAGMSDGEGYEIW